MKQKQNLEQNSSPLIGLLIAQQEDEFLSERSTANSARTVWRCAEFSPCKRMSCDGCIQRRRQYYVYMGARHALALGLNRHATISWLMSPCEDSWEVLSSLGGMIPKRLTGRIGPFMRVMAIGDEGTPHVHYLIHSDFEERFSKLAKDHSPPKSRIYTPTPIYEVEGLLDYLFMKNFVPTVTDPRRIKHMRLMSGSRGDLTYSYPRTKHWDRYIGLQTGEILDE